MFGGQVWVTAQEAPNAHFVKANQFVSTALLLPKHRDKHSIGTPPRTPRHLSRCLQVVASWLSGSAQFAATSGKLEFRRVYETIPAVLNAAELNPAEICSHSQHLKQRNTHCCWNGTMSATPRTAFILKAPPLAAKSGCIGSATNAPRGSCTCTK